MLKPLEFLRFQKNAAFFFGPNMSKLETLESPMILRIRLTPSHFYLIQQQHSEEWWIHMNPYFGGLGKYGYTRGMWIEVEVSNSTPGFPPLCFAPPQMTTSPNVLCPPGGVEQNQPVIGVPKT